MSPIAGELYSSYGGVKINLSVYPPLEWLHSPIYALILRRSITTMCDTHMSVTHSTAL
jgi:hypothetical protein